MVSNNEIEFLKRLPRILLISDVCPDQNSGGGALVLYRLLEKYPSEKLLVITCSRLKPMSLFSKLANVLYLELENPIPRWMFMRFNPFWPVMMAIKSRKLASTALRVIKDYNPEAILTVVQDHLCFVGIEIANKRNIPLHAIIHDDWSHHQTIRHSRWTKPIGVMACDWIIGRLFKRASTISCVSSGMAEKYSTRYGVKTRVMLPCRGNDNPRMRKSMSNCIGKPVIAYAGNIFHKWIAESLNTLADVLETLGGRLDLYISDKSLQASHQWGLKSVAIKHAGFFTPSEMVDRIAFSAGGLFLPASFHYKDKQDAETLFPSKLVDYTTIGLPILIWGPEYSSAVKWAAANPMAAEVVTSSTKTSLLKGIKRILDPDVGKKIAEAGMDAGNNDFDHERIQSDFFKSISLIRGPK